MKLFKIRRNQIVIPILCVTAWMLLAVVASGDSDDKSDTANIPTEITDQMLAKDSIYTLINDSYKSIRPTFEKSCFDCHSAFTNFPWYYKIPGIKTLINNHIKEGMEHLDMTKDFPFGGKGSQAEILNEIKEELQEGEMPIMGYRIMHSGVKVEGEKLDSVVKWVDRSIFLLESIGETLKDRDNGGDH